MKKINLFLIVFMIVLSLSVLMVSAGYLTATSSQGSGGTTFTINWFQGCGPNCDVKYLDGTNWETVNLNLGPNSCNTGASPGNYRAIYCLIGSDAGRTSAIDAVVNCKECPCEDPQNMDFKCNQDTGLCDTCDACTDFNPPLCGAGCTCTHLTCSTADCNCCGSECTSRTTAWSDWSSCTTSWSVSNDLGGECKKPGSQSRTRTVYECHPTLGTCESRTETETQTCEARRSCSSTKYECGGDCDTTGFSDPCTRFECPLRCITSTTNFDYGYCQKNCNSYYCASP